MPVLRMRTIGIGVAAEDGDQTLVDLGFQEDIERVRNRPASAGAAGGRTGAARVICGMCAGGAPSSRANDLVGGGIEAGGEPDEEPAYGRERDGTHHPGRHRGACRPVGRRQRPASAATAPGRAPALADDDRVEVLAQPIEFAGPARRQAIAPLEAERLRQRYISSSTGRNVPGFWRSWLSRSKKRSPLRTSWWNVETSERDAQAPLLPQGVFSTTSSRLAHSA